MSSPQVAVVEDSISRAEVEALREEVRRLTLERAQRPLPSDPGDATGATVPVTPGTVTPPARIVTRFVQLARERKCPMFSGDPGDDTLPIDSWVTEVRKCWEGQELTIAEQVVFIQDHLTGNAKAEIEFHPEPERENPTQIFSLLKEHFCHSQSYVHALAQFCQRQQRADETVREFSYGLKKLMDVVERAAPGAVPNADQLLRDQLIEHVRDAALRRLLDQRLSAEPCLTFAGIRAVAVKWEEARPLVARTRSQSLGALDGVPPVPDREVRVAAVSRPDPPPPQRPSVPVVADGTHRQLEELTRLMARLVGKLDAVAAGLPAPLPQRPVRTPDGRPICFGCGRPGHIARFCTRGAPADRPPDTRPPAEAPRGATHPFPAPARALEATVTEAGNANPPLNLARELGGPWGQPPPRPPQS